MILSFDKFERYELPQVTLCNPNSRATEVDGKITITDTVGVLSNPKGMNLKLNFNAPHELSFDYYRHKSTDPIKQSFYDSIYEAIQTDRYIYLTDIGYFIISNVTDSDEDNIDRKSISLKSCEENELATAEGLYLKEGTYYLHTENKDGLLDLFLPKTAGWTIGFIDPSLLTKPYFVEETEVDNGYNFLYTTIQDMFECIVEPDIIKRTISVYSRVYYAEHHLTDIHIAKYNLLKHKTVEENDEDKYTALNVQGKDENLEIRAVNPTGKNVIYNFEPRYSWMSPGLQQAIEKWQEKCESVEDEYLTLQQGYYAELELLFNEEQNIEVLKGELKTLEETRDAVIVTVGEQQSTALDNVNAQISTKQTEINTKTSEHDTHKETVRTTYEVPISQINSDCALDVTAKDTDGNTIFTTDLLNELMTHIKPTNYVDEYMLVTESMTYSQRFEKAKELMDRAQSQLVKISSGQKTYSIDTRSFLFNKQFRHFSEQLCAGAIIYVETKNDIMEQLHLTGIDINFDEKSTNFTLGNKYDRSDLKALYDDALGQNSKSFSELKYIASIVEDQQKQLNYQRNWVADLRTLTLDNVLTSEDQAIEINNRGLIGRKRRLDENGEWDFDENGNPYFEDEQVKLINNTLVFTEDNWKTASTAVGKIAVGYNSDGSVKYSYGINGQVLIGELILGNNLVLTGTGAGIKITDSNGNKVFYADENGNLVLSSTIYAKEGKIGGWNLDSYRLWSASDKYGTGMSITTTSYDDPAFYAGYYGAGNGDTPWDYPKNKEGFWYDWTKFYVTHAGYLHAEEGDIAGWLIKPNYLGKHQSLLWSDGNYYNYGAGLQASAAGTTDNVLAIGYMPNGVEGTWGSAEFRVTGDGKLYATNANITGVITATSGSFKGEIIAESGNIANWIIDDNVLYNLTNDNQFSTGISALGHKDYPAFWAGYYGSGNTPIGQSGWGGNINFYVTNGGYLYAKDAHVEGNIKATTGSFSRDITIENRSIKNWIDDGGYINEIKATKGSIGGWHINENELYSDEHVGKDINNRTYNQQVFFKPNELHAWYKYADVGNVPVTRNIYTTWYAVVLGAEAYQTQSYSDSRLKNSIEDYSEQYEVFFDKLSPKRYKYNYGTSDRFHAGFIAQDVVRALEESNLTTKDFAGVCLEFNNEDVGYWQMRRDEFVSLNTWQIQKLKKRVCDLENTISELKTHIQALTAG